MARQTRDGSPTHAFPRTVTLKTSAGTRKVGLSTAGGAKQSPMHPVPPALDVLAASLKERWKKLRRLLRNGIPIRNRMKMNEAVHDLRTSARRLLSVLAALEPAADGDPSRRLTRRVNSILDRLGPLRDLSVQLESLAAVKLHDRDGLRPLRSRLLRQEERLARKLRKRLRRSKTGRLKADVRRLLKRTRRAKKAGGHPALRRTSLQPAREAFLRLREARLALNPTDVDTIHRLRIALKKFRYLMEALGPLARGVGTAELETLHKLQTTLGDIHDLEVLSTTIARHIEKQGTEGAAKLTPLLARLERRHSAMLRSCLRGVDPILGFWERLLRNARSARAGTLKAG